MKGFLRAVLTIVGGLLLVAVVGFILLVAMNALMPGGLEQATLDMQAYDARAAGEATGNAIADAVEASFVPGLMIGMLILVAWFMRRFTKAARAPK